MPSARVGRMTPAKAGANPPTLPRAIWRKALPRGSRPQADGFSALRRCGALVAKIATFAGYVGRSTGAEAGSRFGAANPCNFPVGAAGFAARPLRVPCSGPRDRCTSPCHPYGNLVGGGADRKNSLLSGISRRRERHDPARAGLVRVGRRLKSPSPQIAR